MYKQGHHYQQSIYHGSKDGKVLNVYLRHCKNNEGPKFKKFTSRGGIYHPLGNVQKAYNAMLSYLALLCCADTR